MSDTLGGRFTLIWLLVLPLLGACESSPLPATGDGGPTAPGVGDGGAFDAGSTDGGADAGPLDGGPSTAPGAVGWILDESSLARLLDGGPDATALAQAYFNTAGTFLISGQPPTYPQAAWTRTFTAVDAGLLPALAGCGLPASVAAVLVDIESWSLTPQSDKSAPIAAYAAAWKAVQGYNADCRDGGAPLLVVAAPATDLVSILEPDAGAGDKYDAFLSLGLASGIAPSCDLFEIQAQGSEMDPALFVQFVDGAAAQASAAHPGVRIYAGISTNPDGQRADAGVIYADILSTLGTVTGYWLNIPAQGAYCPNCGVAQPGVATALLRLMDPDAG